MSSFVRLSKSKIMAGMQCQRRLWLEMHRRELAHTSPAREHIFRMGHFFGEHARSLIGRSGPHQLIGHVHDVRRAVEETRVALERASQRRITVYEAAFSHQDVVARTDGFASYRAGWHMTEVKAAISVKEYFYQDCAIQAWVAEGAGFPVRKVTLACINGRFVYPGNGDYSRLLRRIDATEEVERRKAAVGSIVEQFRAMLSESEPMIATGKHCSTPYACPFIGHCGDAQTESKRFGNVRFIRRISSIASAVRAYPIHFFRFGTVSSPVPLWARTRPYQRIPVQWSCQTEAHSGALVHRAFLERFDASSKQELVHSLIDALGAEGPIIVGSWSERACFEALCECVPERQAEIRAVMRRLVFLTFSTRGVDFASSMPVSGEVTDEQSAQRAWWEAASSSTDPERSRRLANDMLSYGRHMTLSMYAAYRRIGVVDDGSWRASMRSL
ncbi:DUF2779 domain-containing protein [Caballeronia novacaledonica]|uniref:DUF2779 domain-containing protein n=1 Tax=Caballeronia novacaledonica TaxID=1544861 RepID=UPI001EE359B7|nr:DUF2779 domain-containing protein [Caballeronia novacaledonica]GJH13600.1 DUF2779 domain-containing protein [Caballeronia novacaledonica]